MDHPKEEKINQWLQGVKNPTLKDIFQEFSPDLEAVVMASTLAGLEMNMDLKDFCRGIPLADRVERYSAYPLWFKTFIRQDIDHAIKILSINGDADGYGQEIVQDWVDEDEYLNLVKNAQPFPGNSTKVKFEQVILNDEKNSDNSLTEHNIDNEFRKRITTGERLSFENDQEKNVFYFLKLQNFAEITHKSLKEMGKYSDKMVDAFVCRDVLTKLLVTDKDVLIDVTSDIALLFDIEPKITWDRKGLTSAVGKNIKDEAVDYVTEGLVEDVAALVGGRALILGKIALKLAKKTKEAKEILDENISISFDDSDESDFYDRFVSANTFKGMNLREFFVSEVKMPLQRVYIKNRLDFSQLTDEFFEKQYQAFIQKRFYSKLGELPLSVQKRFNQMPAGDEKDTLLFITLSRYREQDEVNDLLDKNPLT